jgi:hypothetical protein
MGGILAMKKRSYRAQKVNEVPWEVVAQRVKGKAVVLAIEVAKVEQYGVMLPVASPCGGQPHGSPPYLVTSPNHSTAGYHD